MEDKSLDYALRQVYVHYPGPMRVAEDDWRFCPRCGAELVIRALAGRARQQCPRCGWVRYRNPLPTISLLITDGERYLLGRRTGEPETGKWATPSGYVELDEDYITGAQREAREETGLVVRVTGIMNATSSFFAPASHFYNVYLLAEPVGGALRSGDDLDDARWFTWDEPLPEMAFQEDVDMIAAYRQGHRGLPVAPGRWTAQEGAR